MSSQSFPAAGYETKTHQFSFDMKFNGVNGIPLKSPLTSEVVVFQGRSWYMHVSFASETKMSCELTINDNLGPVRVSVRFSVLNAKGEEIYTDGVDKGYCSIAPLHKSTTQPQHKIITQIKNKT